MHCCGKNPQGNSWLRIFSCDKSKGNGSECRDLSTKAHICVFWKPTASTPPTVGSTAPTVGSTPPVFHTTAPAAPSTSSRPPSTSPPTTGPTADPTGQEASGRKYPGTFYVFHFQEFPLTSGNCITFRFALLGQCKPQRKILSSVFLSFFLHYTSLSSDPAGTDDCSACWNSHFFQF